MSFEPSLLTLSLYPCGLGYALRPKKDTEGCKKYIALTAAEPCFVLSAVIGAVETVFWAAIFLLAETVHLLTHKCFETPTLIRDWVYEMLESSATITAVASLFAVSNFCIDNDD